MEVSNATRWTKIADEDDDDLPELVKSVYRKGDDLNRHLILLDDYGAGFFGLDIKPKPVSPRVQLPDAHVDLQVRGDVILIMIWDGPIILTMSLKKTDPDAWDKIVDDARNHPAGLVIDELYRNELEGDSKFKRGETSE